MSLLGSSTIGRDSRSRSIRLSAIVVIYSEMFGGFLISGSEGTSEFGLWFLYAFLKVITCCILLTFFCLLALAGSIRCFGNSCCGCTTSIEPMSGLSRIMLLSPPVSSSFLAAFLTVAGLYRALILLPLMLDLIFKSDRPKLCGSASSSSSSLIRRFL